jgi:hypothetical protein
MLVVIQDLRGRYLRTLKGQYKDGKFVYKQGGIGIGVLKIGQEEKNLPCDYSQTIDKGKFKEAYYEYDGKEIRANKCKGFLR